MLTAGGLKSLGPDRPSGETTNREAEAAHAATLARKAWEREPLSAIRRFVGALALRVAVSRIVPLLRPRGSNRRARRSPAVKWRVRAPVVLEFGHR